MSQNNSRARPPQNSRTHFSKADAPPAPAALKLGPRPQASAAKAMRKGRVEAQMRRRAAELRALLRELD
jgi:hypothetical protein